MQTASGEIERHTEQVSTSSKAALQHVQTKKEEVDAAAEQLLQSRQLKDDERTPAVDPKAAAVVERASDELKTKPESSFTAEDHFARGLSQFAKGNHLSALESFRAAYQAGPETTPTDAPVRYLFAQGVTLGKLDKPEEAIAVYDEMDRRFGKDESPGVRSVVARARNAAAFGRIISAKQHWQDVPRKTALLAAAIKGLESALLICADDDRAVVSGNLGYALFLRGDHGAAVEPTRDCLKLGGGAALAAQQDDAKQQRVEPEDSDYEALLTRLWAELHPSAGLPGAGSQGDS